MKEIASLCLWENIKCMCLKNGTILYYYTFSLKIEDKGDIRRKKAEFAQPVLDHMLTTATLNSK